MAPLMRRKSHLFIFLVSILFTMNCGNGLTPQMENGGPPPPSWVFQLQNIKIDALAESGFTLAVIDYSKDGTDPKQFSKEEIQRLVANDVTPISYISIGEAESYRYYWGTNWLDEKDKNKLTADAPGWLGHTNPDWVGNYKVRYWDPDWREHFVKPYLDKIIQQGFHGVYLDIIDGFEYWADPETYNSGMETLHKNDPVDNEAKSAQRMIELVQWIAQYCREQSPLGDDFMIFPQNGERILIYDGDGSYLKSVSGIGVEDTWYDKTNKNSDSTVKYRLQFLDQFRKNRKTVLSVDYVDTGDHKSSANLDRIKDYLSQCRSRGFACYAAHTNVALNIANRIQDIQP